MTTQTTAPSPTPFWRTNPFKTIALCAVANAPVIWLLNFSDNGPIATNTWFYAASIVWMFALNAYAFRWIDEVARMGQKTAWLWGGLAGIGFAFILIPFLPAVDNLDNIRDWLAALRKDGADYTQSSAFVLGLFFMLLMQCIGFAAYWAFWWIAKR